MAFTGFVIGAMPMGRIEHVASCSVLTRFSMINGLPLRALGSYLDLAGRTVEIPLHRRSVAAGFLRPWATIAAAISLLAGAWSPWLLLSTVPLAALAAYMWWSFGALSPAEKRMRLAYATWLGAPFDPAHLAPDADTDRAAALRAFVDERTAQAPAGYRKQLADPWRAVATESDDPALLVAALTRARFERRGAGAAERAELDALHAAIWARLDPMLLAHNAPRELLDWQAHLARHEGPSMSRRHLVAVVVGVVALCAIAVPILLYLQRPKLAVVNASGSDGLTILLDGQPLAERLPTARRENDGAFRVKLLASGEHEIVARDANGVEVDRRRFTITKGDRRAFLYAPSRGKSICFFHERYTYASTAHLRDHDAVLLDLLEPLITFEHPIDVWFGEPPQSIKLSGSASAERTTVRALPCPAQSRRERR